MTIGDPRAERTAEMSAEDRLAAAARRRPRAVVNTAVTVAGPTGVTIADPTADPTAERTAGMSAEDRLAAAARRRPRAVVNTAVTVAGPTGVTIADPTADPTAERTAAMSAEDRLVRSARTGEDWINAPRVPPIDASLNPSKCNVAISPPALGVLEWDAPTPSN